MSNSSIWPIDRTLSSATTPGKSRHGTVGNAMVLRLPQISSITEASPSDCLVSYPRCLLGEGLTPQQRCSRCILQPEPTGLVSVCLIIWLQRKLHVAKSYVLRNILGFEYWRIGSSIIYARFYSAFSTLNYWNVSICKHMMKNHVFTSV